MFSRTFRTQRGVHTLSKATRWKTAATSYFTSTDRRPIILYDGVCNLCNGGVNFVLEWDSKQALRFAALQSPAGRALLQQAGRSPDDISSIVLVENDASAHIKSQAILKIAQYIDQPFPIAAKLGMILPAILADALYDFIATHRYGFFGKSDRCRLSSSDEATGMGRFITTE